jgi:hypothetical protein
MLHRSSLTLPARRLSFTGRLSGTVHDDFQEPWMPSERLSQAELDTRKPDRQVLAQGRQISPNVYSCRQEIGQHHDVYGALIHALGCRFRNGRFRQLQERGNDHVKVAAFSHLGCNEMQIVICLRLSATVRHQQECRFHTGILAAILPR